MTSPISSVSDTARWVAMYRAMESERSDALFHDTYARRLAGPTGEQILASMPQGRRWAWPMIVRTAVMDEIIMRVVRDEGLDTIVNLAAGLDARPYRLDLPPQLHWIDVEDRKSTRLNSSHRTISYAVFCLKKKKKNQY